MKIAVTGTSGYVGGAIASAFREHGHEVLSLSRRPCPQPWLQHSLGDDPTSIPWENVHALIHAAHDFTAANAAENQDHNIVPSVALFNAAAAAGVRHLIFISSMSCFVGCTSHYGKAKLAIEQQIARLNPAIVRPGLVWGGETGGVMAALEATVLRLPVVPYLTGRNKLRQYLIHQEDLATTLVRIVGEAPPQEPLVINAYHPQPQSLLEILKTLAARHSKKRLFFPVPCQFAMLGLKSLETLRIRPPFRSDSLQGLVFANPFPASPDNPSCYRPFR
jgi:nucleoside-diphosphate-sugar epimerase